jgi:signal transduction histidine kinase
MRRARPSRARRSRLLRSTPFRVALIAAALFILAFTVASLVAFRSIHTDLAEKLDRTITDTYSVMLAAYSPDDIEDLIGSVDAHVTADSGRDQVFMLTGRDGASLAGNVPARPIQAGWATLASSELGLPGDGRYRTFTGDFDGYRLMVGMSEADVSEINEIALTSFASAAALVLVLALAGGATLAINLQRRMQAIATTMSQVSEGELAARIQLTGNGDDIDMLSMQVNDALERLAASFESMRQVSVDIAHDLKTPLNRLRLAIEEAMEAQREGRDVAAQLADARAESDQINATFDALLRIAQIESGARKSRFARVDLVAMVAEIAEVFADVAEDGGKTLTTEIEAEAAETAGDRELLIQLFSNLVENAIRHTPDGTTIRIGVSATAGEATAWVGDNGPGIPLDEREKVLRRLYRLEQSRTSLGSGLGLSLVKAIAELHGAALELGDNEPGLKVTLRFRPAVEG